MKEKVIFYSKKILTITICLLFGVIGYLGGYYYRDYQANHIDKPNYNKVTKFDDISVLTNEKHQLMIIDKKNSSFVLYNDSVGQYIFNVYAGYIYNQTKQ